MTINSSQHAADGSEKDCNAFLMIQSHRKLEIKPLYPLLSLPCHLSLPPYCAWNVRVQWRLQCIPKRKWISDTEPRLFKTQVPSSVFLPFKYQQSFWSTGWRLYSIHQLWPFSQFALLACCFIDAALAILYDMFLVHFGPNGRGYGCSVKYTVVNYTSRI